MTLNLLNFDQIHEFIVLIERNLRTDVLYRKSIIEAKRFQLNLNCIA